MLFHEPILHLATRRVNATLHGRSVHRPVDVPGHNVFKGYGIWSVNGHVGVGDAVDLFGDAGEAVFAIADGVQVQWQGDTTRKERVYIAGHVNGMAYIAVYAHINAVQEGQNIPVKRGTIVGHLRSDLADPHLHFELWLAGNTLHAPTPDALRDKIAAKCGPLLL